MEASTIITALYVFVLAAFVGYQVISSVPPLLHTPLMSATNAISGITLIGAIISAGTSNDLVTILIGTSSVAFATINVVGGYLVTDRMLAMFKKKNREGK